MSVLLAKYTDTHVLFSDYVNKCNSKDKLDYRALMVTNNNIFKQDPKNYKVKAYEVPLVAVKSITLSPLQDGYVVVHANEPYRDLVVDLGINNIERYSEFVTVIVQQVKNLTGNTIQVKFSKE